VPLLREVIASGDLSLSKARRIVTVLTKDNCQEWINKANTFKQGPLERQSPKLILLRESERD